MPGRVLSSVSVKLRLAVLPCSFDQTVDLVELARRAEHDAGDFERAVRVADLEHALKADALQLERMDVAKPDRAAALGHEELARRDHDPALAAKPRDDLAQHREREQRRDRSDDGEHD